MRTWWVEPCITHCYILSQHACGEEDIREGAMRRLEKEIPRMLRIERKESGYACFLFNKRAAGLWFPIFKLLICIPHINQTTRGSRWILILHNNATQGVIVMVPIHPLTHIFAYFASEVSQNLLYVFYIRVNAGRAMTTAGSTVQIKKSKASKHLLKRDFHSFYFWI